MTTIENRQGQNIHDGEVDRNHHQEPDEIEDALIDGICTHLHNTDDATHFHVLVRHAGRLIDDSQHHAETLEGHRDHVASELSGIASSFAHRNRVVDLLSIDTDSDTNLAGSVGGERNRHLVVVWAAGNHNFHRNALVGLNGLGQVFWGDNLATADRNQLVIGLQASIASDGDLGGRNVFDVRAVHVVARFANEGEESKEHDHRRDDIEDHAGCRNANALPDRKDLEVFSGIRIVLEQLLSSGFILKFRNGNVAASQNGRQAKFGVPEFAQDNRPLARAKADGENRCLETEQASNEPVSELVNGDQ
eukprot:Opistho-1_new@70526